MTSSISMLAKITVRECHQQLQFVQVCGAGSIAVMLHGLVTHPTAGASCSREGYFEGNTPAHHMERDDKPYMKQGRGLTTGTGLGSR